MAVQAQQLQASTAQLGIPVPLTYGPAHATGNLFALKEIDDVVYGPGTRIAGYLLAEGEWTAQEKLWVNRKEFDFTNTDLCHFHPGLDGEIGTGSTGGDGKGDAFLSLLGFDPQITFSRTAQLWLKIPPDPGAVSSDLEVIGNYKTTKVRLFNSAGEQIAYEYSTVPAWWVHDLIVRAYIKPLALLNDALTAPELALFDFPAWNDAVAYQSEILSARFLVEDIHLPSGVIIGGVIEATDTRFSGGVAFVQQQTLTQALDQILTMSRSYVRVVNGKMQLRVDNPDTIKFFISQEHIIDDVQQPTGGKPDLGGAANAINGHFLDLEGIIADIDSEENIGLRRVGGVVTCVCLAAPGAKVGDKIGVLGSEATTATAFDGDGFALTFASGNTLEWLQAGEDSFGGNGVITFEDAKFTERNIVANHEAHQRAKGLVGVGLGIIPKEINLDLDLGVNTFARVRRLLYFLKTRDLGVDQSTVIIGDEVIPFMYKAPGDLTVKLNLDAVDKLGNAIDEVFPGDKVNVNKNVSDEMEGDYEVIESGWDFSGWNNAIAQATEDKSDVGEGRVGAITTLQLKQMVPEAYSDVLPEDIEDAPPPGVFSTDWMYPTLAVDDASAGTVPWATPEGVEGPDDDADKASISILASPVVAAPAHSHYLKSTGFGFALASGAVIKGIEVRERRFALQAGVQSGLTGITVIAPGVYHNNIPPSVVISGGGGSGAAAIASLGLIGFDGLHNPILGVTRVDLISSGLGYTSAPSISFVGGDGSGALGSPVWSPPFNGKAFVQDEAVRLCKAGVIQTADKSIATMWEQDGSDHILLYGNHDDAWSLVLSGADVNNVGFGFARRVLFTETDNAGNVPAITAWIASVAMRVFYQ